MKSIALYLFVWLCATLVKAQTGTIAGIVQANNRALSHVSVQLDHERGTLTAANGRYLFNQVAAGSHVLYFSALGLQKQQHKIITDGKTSLVLNITLVEASEELGEVVITGVSRATAIRKNPIPMVVMQKAQMNQLASNNVIDVVVKGAPGVSAVTTGPNISKPFIRGLGYNRVLTLYDGIRQEGQQWGDEHGIEVDQFALSRVEVVKGPASLTYGSDALAGVINLLPEIPAIASNKLSGDVSTVYQSNNGLLAASLGLAYRKQDWTYTVRASQRVAHNYQNPVDGWVYNTAFRELTLTGLAQVNKKWGSSRIGATWYNNRQEIPDGSRDSLTRRFTYQPLDKGDDIKARPLVPDSWLHRYKLTPLQQHIQHYRLYTQTHINIGQGHLSTLLALQQNIRQEYNHPTQPRQAGLYVVLNSLNYDLKYNLPAWHGWEATLGTNGMYQANSSKEATDFPIPDYQLLDGGIFFTSKRSFVKIDISGGLRYDARRVSWSDQYIGPDPTNGFEKKVALPNTAGARLQFPAFGKTYSGISGSLGLTYNLSRRVLIKANVARGYRAPNITEIGSNGLDPGAHIVYLGNRSFKPEFSLQQDVGVSAYLPDADLNLELFNNSISNYIYQARLTDAAGNPVVIVPGNITYQYQQASAQLYGAEVTINLHPQKIKWLAFNNSLSTITGLNRNKALVEMSNGAAKYLPLIPALHWRSQVKLSCQGKNSRWMKPYFMTELDMYAAQNKFYAYDNTETYTPGYKLVNIGLGTIIQNKTGRKIADFIFNIDNLFNVAYQSNLSRLKYFEYYTASPNGRSGIYNMGRNLSFKIIVPF